MVEHDTVSRSSTSERVYERPTTTRDEKKTTEDVAETVGRRTTRNADETDATRVHIYTPTPSHGHETSIGGRREVGDARGATIGEFRVRERITRRDVNENAFDERPCTSPASSLSSSSSSRLVSSRLVVVSSRVGSRVGPAPLTRNVLGRARRVPVRVRMLHGMSRTR